MSNNQRERIVRVTITLVILLSGVAMAPFVDVQGIPISWERLAGVYTPDLTVNETTGAPGSIFSFTGSNYPPNRLATVYVDGVTVGQVLTDGSGNGSFLLNTTGATAGSYNVTMEVDINASATQSIDLVSGAQTVPPPAGNSDPIFRVGYAIYFPAIELE